MRRTCFACPVIRHGESTKVDSEKTNETFQRVRQLQLIELKRQNLWNLWSWRATPGLVLIGWIRRPRKTAVRNLPNAHFTLQVSVSISRRNVSSLLLDFGGGANFV